MKDDNIQDKNNVKKTKTRKKTISKKDDIKFEDLDGKLLLVTVGDDKNPAKNDDIKNIESKLLSLLEDNNINCAVFVAHHLVNIKVIK